MEIVNRYDPTEEYQVDLPVEGMTIHRFHEERETFDEPSTIIWRVEHDDGIPQGEEKLVSCVSHFDWTCDPESYRCNHEHDCCGCAFTMSFDVEYVGKKLAYIRKRIGLNY
tara:strand:+ start:154 stop:486 length:333 start_codon:yes stop_codon:yes gene_type:complete